MSDISIEDFKTRYADLAQHAVADERFLELVRSDPKAALRDVGLAVPDSVEVGVELASDGSTAVEASTLADAFEELYAKWNEGIASGHLTLVVPQVVPVEFSEVGDDELVSVAGGIKITISIGIEIE